METCTCTAAESHIIARRETSDGVCVLLWSDGAVTAYMGRAFPGVPIARPRTAIALDVCRAAGWLLAGEVALYDVAELSALYAACRFVAARSGNPGDVRARLAMQSRPRVTPHWTVTRADRDGVPTERQWRLPRLRWLGLAVFDYCNRAERYEVVTFDRKDVASTTGVRFATLDGLSDYLFALPSATR